MKTKKQGFTIIELLTVMSIIILLMGLFIPAMNMLRRYAQKVSQYSQFHTIEVALTMFNAEWQDYPNPTAGALGFGAVALSESTVGRDLLGYDPDGTYNQGDLSGRCSYIEAQNANPNPISLYPGDTESLDPNIYVLSDVYSHVTHPVTGRSFGMPILYYKASVSNHYHSQADADAGNSIYDYADNHSLVEALSVPDSDAAQEHALFIDPQATFYEDTVWSTIFYLGEDVVVPYRATSYILLSAGFDGEYGSRDDVYNFRVRQ
jgi:type II secretory pathway pseudopilin PulG